MELNLPILPQLAESKSILIAGAGGGFDVFAGLPLYFTLRARGKNVHLANLSFTEFRLAALVSEIETLLPDLLVGARGRVKHTLSYLPEPLLAQWFQQQHAQDITIWMLANSGGRQLKRAYQHLVEHLQVDALILIDGGVDSLMRGDESGSGTLVEDTLSLAAVRALPLPVKILGCIGFGTEVEEAVCHYNALENMAALTKAGAFLGVCALTPQMLAFQQFEAACRYVWEQKDHHKSHISTRIIPAVRGEFGAYDMYNDHFPGVCLSPLMGLYWFFDAATVIQHNKLIDALADTHDKPAAFRIADALIQRMQMRPRRALPY
ncbi:MAG: DUF1152 domain-containing protein [Chloroflexi bacterium]|nr:DUF1152 domain-containing protein [Chloroflexota bacterium]